MTAQDGATESFGANAWLVDEMYERYVADPESVAASWRDFFADYRPAVPDGGADGAAASPVDRPPDEIAAAPPPAATPAPAPGTDGDESSRRVSGVQPIRGAGARIVANMEASLAVPTATSVRDVPARLLEVNRKVMNGYLARTGGGKVSFTHLIGYAVVKAVEAVPAMNAS